MTPRIRTYDVVMTDFYARLPRRTVRVAAYNPAAARAIAAERHSWIPVSAHEVRS